MRKFILIPVLVLAACGGGETEQNKAAPKAATIAPGQWELTSEVTAFEAPDQGSPHFDTSVGTRTTETLCVGEGQRPPTAFFAGEGYRCAYDNYYVRNGRMNVTLRCSREGLTGIIPIMADGRFEEETLEYARELSTSLAGGAVRISTSVTGRRVGDCPAESADEDGNQSGGQ